MKTKLLVLFLCALQITAYAQTACDSLTISATTPNPVVSCEDFPMIISINNPSGINFNNINFGIKFAQVSSITTFPPAHDTVAGYWVYDTINISAHTTFIDTIIIHYDCNSVAIRLDDFSSISVTDSLRISHGDTLCLGVAANSVTYDLGSPA